MAAKNRTYHTGKLLLSGLGVLLIGWLAGHPLAFLAAAALAYLGWHLVNLWRLHAWLENPADEVPEGAGIWRQVFDAIGKMEQKNRRQNERYRNMIGEFRSLTNAFPDATLVVDENDAITWFNDAAANLLGLRSPQDLGQVVTNLLRGPDFADWLAVEDRVNSPLEMPSPKNPNRWLSLSAVSFGESQRLLIMRDVTGVHEVERIRRDFVANISHEIRTPLTVLQGYLEMLQEHPAGEVSDAVSRMQVQTRQMKSLLDDLLELSRLQSDELQGEEAVLDVPALLMQLREQAEELSQGAHELDFQADQSLLLFGVAADIESAFSNLISNAIRYSPDGGTVTVRWHESEGGPALSVTDTGIGVPQRDIPRLTERFYRVGSDRARQTGGTGLGLAIVKHVLNAHQAKLLIESELGEGSTFTATFPPERARQAPASL